MRSARLTLLVALFMSGSPALASRLESPQLRNLSDYACLLAPNDQGDQALTCWNTNGVPASIPYFKHPVSLTVIGDDFCVSDGGRVRCWGYGQYHEEYERPLNRAFSAFENVRQLSVNADHSGCFVYGTGQVGCVDGDTGDRKIKHPPALGPIAELAAADDDACALTTDGKATCWGTYNDPKTGADVGIALLSRPPADLSFPHALHLTRDRLACVLNDNQLRCWGDGPTALLDDSKKAIARLEGFAQKIGRPLLDYSFVALDHEKQSAVGLLAADIDGKVWWVTDKTATAQAFSVPGFQQGILVSGDDFTMYAADREQLAPISSCCGEGFRMDAPYYHKLRVAFPILPLLQGLLKDGREHTYQEKARIFAAAEKMLPLADDDERYFLLGALRPLIEGSDSAYMRDNILPRYQQALRDTPHPELRGFTRTPSVVVLSAKLIRETFVSPTEEPWIFLALPLGQLMVSGQDGDRRDLVAAYRAHAKAFDEIAANDRYAPLVHFLQGLVGVLSD